MYDFAQPMAVKLLEAVLCGTVLDEPKASHNIVTLQNTSDSVPADEDDDNGVNVEVTADVVAQEYMMWLQSYYLDFSLTRWLVLTLPASQDDLYSFLLPHKKACARYTRKIGYGAKVDIHATFTTTLRKLDKL